MVNKVKSKFSDCGSRRVLSILIAFQIILLICISVRVNAQSGFEGDIDSDWDIDTIDMAILARQWLDTDCNEPNWCGGADLDNNHKVDFADLVILNKNWRKGTGGDLTILHVNNSPTRLAIGPGGRIYVSNPRANAVFIYDANLSMIGEIKNLNRPLGVAVAGDGRIYVGNNGSDNIEIYNQAGTKIATFAQGAVSMPTDMALDRQGNLYVVDSLADTVRVYDPDGQWLRNIGSSGDGDGGLKFPVAVAVSHYGSEDEIYVADQGHAKIQVFDLQGNFQRAFGKRVSQFGSNWHGRFVRIQSIAIDGQGRVHAADCYMNNIQILNAQNGDYISSYGSFGTSLGQLNLPLDIAITDSGQTVVTNIENKRVEIITVP